MSETDTNTRAGTPVPLQLGGAHLERRNSGGQDARPPTFVPVWQRFSGLNIHSATELPYPEFRERALRLIDEFKPLVRVELDEDYKLRKGGCQGPGPFLVLAERRVATERSKEQQTGSAGADAVATWHPEFARAETGGAGADALPVAHGAPQPETGNRK